MIAQLRGVVSEKSPTRIILDVQGIGYEVLIPISTFEAIADSGEEIKLLTYLHVREDAMTLFGFSSLKEKSMFLKLISVSGIGPKLALGILSGCRVDELIAYIVNNQVESLTRLPGVGKKTAQRIAMELKDKFDVESRDSYLASTDVQVADSGKLQEAAMALTSLGFTKAAAEKSLNAILAGEPELSVEELVKKALKANQ